MQLLRCPRGGEVYHSSLRSSLGADWLAHDPILDPRKTQTAGPLTINMLARDMVMDRTTLGRNILPLERDSLIRIEATISDRRAKELHLTKAGEKRLQVVHERWSEAQSRFETTFGPRRAAELRKMLRAAVASEFGPADGGSAESPTVKDG
jgi:DNA-binding MarR family transcriptional regulator